MKIHFYMLCYRFEALVASHLEPEAFGLYMAVGTQKNTRGNVVFFEVDRNLKSDYFRLSDIEKRCANSDGSPKRSKYISTYRVLEHLPLSSLGKLYLTTADGRTIELDASQYDAGSEKKGIHLYEELCPVLPMVVSKLAPSTFSKFMTEPQNPIAVPKIFFADMIIDRENDGRLAGYLPYPHTYHIVDCINELEHSADKTTKTVTRSPLHQGFYRTINKGFFVGDQTGIKFYKFPERRVLEIEHSEWWRSASESLVEL